MKEILKNILFQVNSLDGKINKLDDNFIKLDDKFNKLDDKFTKLDNKVNKLDRKVSNLDKKVSQVDSKVTKLDHRVGNLEITVHGMKEEHGSILRAIIDGKEIQRKDIDTVTHRTTKIEETIKEAAKQILDDLKEVSNQ
ncbi:MAG: hypothetical protein RO469_11875 [Thermincola sp.]|nr:hypothetical protein [Thermincola sp.]MDT3703512.1 hypothetical protein [Thermincola sp.]